MALSDGSSALDKLGQVMLPIGTLKEIQKAGHSPEKVASCHPESTPGVRGCPYWKSCQFDKKKFGGFKEKGPRYVGYYLQTDEGDQKEDFCACYVFTAKLRPRMIHGMNQAALNLPHETIRVIAQEGEEVITREGIKDPNIPNNNRVDNPVWIWHTEEKKVPHFPRPGENPKHSYNQKVAAREDARRRAEEGMEDETAEAMIKAHRKALKKEEKKVIAEPVSET